MDFGDGSPEADPPPPLTGEEAIVMGDQGEHSEILKREPREDDLQELRGEIHEDVKVWWE